MDETARSSSQVENTMARAEVNQRAGAERD